MNGVVLEAANLFRKRIEITWVNPHHKRPLMLNRLRWRAA
jgi:hypothetical protein